MLYYYKMYDTKLNQTYKFDCLEQMLKNLILTMNLEPNNKEDLKSL